MILIGMLYVGLGLNLLQRCIGQIQTPERDCLQELSPPDTAKNPDRCTYLAILELLDPMSPTLCSEARLLDSTEWGCGITYDTGIDAGHTHYYPSVFSNIQGFGMTYLAKLPPLSTL